jgi:hypothetical protein
VKEDMSGGGYEGRDYHSTGDFIVGGFLLDLEGGEFEFCSRED